MGGQHQAPAALPPENYCTHCTGSWVGLRTGLGVCEKSRPHRIFFLYHNSLFITTSLTSTSSLALSNSHLTSTVSPLSGLTNHVLTIPTSTFDNSTTSLSAVLPTVPQPPTHLTHHLSQETEEYSNSSPPFCGQMTTIPSSTSISSRSPCSHRTTGRDQFTFYKPLNAPTSTGSHDDVAGATHQNPAAAANASAHTWSPS
jgi:hypothetical protein